jgi:hypothetical protein
MLDEVEISAELAPKPPPLRQRNIAGLCTIAAGQASRTIWPLVRRASRSRWASAAAARG